MDPYENYSTLVPAQEKNPMSWFVYVVIIGLFALAAWLIVLSAVGYGHATFGNLPANSVVTLNGHTIKTSQNLKLRPGSYEVSVESPLTQPYKGTMKVGVFQTTDFKPQLETRAAASIVSSTIGAYGQYGAPSIDDAKWFNNNSWLAGVVGPGSAAPIAIHYEGNAWKVKYFLSGTYPQDKSVLPTDVAQYVASLEQKYAEQ